MNTIKKWKFQNIFFLKTLREHPVSEQSSFKIKALTLFAILEDIILIYESILFFLIPATKSCISFSYTSNNLIISLGLFWPSASIVMILSNFEFLIPV